MGYCIKLITVEITCRMPCPANVGQAKMDVDEREKDILGLTQGEPLNEASSRLKLLDFHMLDGQRLAVERNYTVSREPQTHPSSLPVALIPE
jgi:hypothetical protein